MIILSGMSGAQLMANIRRYHLFVNGQQQQRHPIIVSIYGNNFLSEQFNFYIQTQSNGDICSSVGNKVSYRKYFLYV